MLTINLEKELIRQNKKLLMPKELLIIKEFDRCAELVNSDVLQRVGIDRNLKAGKEIKSRLNLHSDQIKIFNQERVFHISQIESICKKYRLRFLPSYLFNGVVDTELPNRITNFEIAYNVKCNTGNSYIIAPPDSFNLQEKPKDPLFLFQINAEYFYLIHKWGNDLSFFRRLIPLFENGLFSFLIVLSVPVCIGLFQYALFQYSTAESRIIASLLVAISIIWGIWCAVVFIVENEPFTLLDKNKWNSEYL